MKKKFLRVFFLGLGLLAFVRAGAAAELIRREWTVDGVKREGLVHVPPGMTTKPVAVVFVFHGHGGSMLQASRSMPVQERWPEALVVFLQGLPTPGQLTDEAGKRDGWQAKPGDQGDRDLKFFDAVWRSLKADYRVDEKRVYAMGHSNGGSFTYLLWAQRNELFAAFGPSGSLAPPAYGRLQPRPVIHVAGENDPLVKFAWQKRMIDELRRINQCVEGRPAGPHCTLYDSKVGAPVMTYIYPGGHEFPSEATNVMVEFFKNHPKP